MTPAKATAARLQLADDLVLDVRLSKTALRLGLRLLSKYYNDKRGYAWPSRERLADDLQASVSTITLAAQRLDRLGYFAVQWNKGSGRTNKYYPRFVVEAIQGKPSQPEAQDDIYARGRRVLGESSRGLVAKLIEAKGGNIPLARAALEVASTKADPREYVGGVLRNEDVADHSKRPAPRPSKAAPSAYTSRIPPEIVAQRDAGNARRAAERGEVPFDDDYEPDPALEEAGRLAAVDFKRDFQRDLDRELADLKGARLRPFANGRSNGQSPK